MQNHEIIGQDLSSRVEKMKKQMSSLQVWQKISRELFQRRVDFRVFQEIYQLIFNDWDDSSGPRPAWIPTDEEVKKTNIYQTMLQMGFSTYEQFYQFSIEDKERFWQETIKKLNITLKRPFTKLMDVSHGAETPRWFANGRLNIVDSCFQRDPEKIAIVFQKEGGPIERWTYGDLEKQVNQVANALVRAGYKKGDFIAIDMPMNGEAVSIYLGIIKAGMSVVSIADSFAPEEIALRLKITRPVLIFTQDVMVRDGKTLALYAKVKKASSVKCVCLLQTDFSLQEGDISFKDFIAQVDDHFISVECDPDDVTNVLFSSGTTGDPKAILWTHLTPIKCASDGFYHQDIQAQDVVCWPTNLGWMMGPWLIYATLLNGASMGLYYGAPTGRDFGKFVCSSGISILGVVPSLVKVWKSSQCMEQLDFSGIKCFTSTGECSNSEDYLYLMSLASFRPVIEYCGGTEVGGGYVTGTLVSPQSPGTFSTPALGLEIMILDQEDKPGEEGEVFLVPPSIGLSHKLLNYDHHQVYFAETPKFPGKILRRHGDILKRLGRGYFQGQGRVDDTMNLGGIKVSSLDIERVLNKLEGVTETAAVAVYPSSGGPSKLVVFTVVTTEISDIRPKMQHLLREKLNPLFKISEVKIVDSLPRTATNKIMRRALRSQFLNTT
jgi:acetyl-CoA synthetase